MQQEMFRQAVTMMQKQQSRLKARVDDEHRAAAATSKSGSTSAAALEATVAAEVRVWVTWVVRCGVQWLRVPARPFSLRVVCVPMLCHMRRHHRLHIVIFASTWRLPG